MREIADIEETIPLFDHPERFGEIEAYLTAHSNLPGPRGNLTLAGIFADWFARKGISRELLDMLIGWARLSSDEAPINDPKEYLTFCGILSLGAHYCHAAETTRRLIMEQLKSAMNDRRWRTREAAAMAFQRIAEVDFDPVRRHFSMWYPGSTLLEKRAFVAALAHPPVLVDQAVALFALRMSGDILDCVLTVGKEERRGEDFRVLSKGLQYALSVFTAASPDAGFALLERYARVNDPEMRRIIRANVSKSRLTKRYARMVDEVRTLLR